MQNPVSKKFVRLKGLCHDVWSYFKSRKMSLNQKKPKNNYSVCLCETILHLVVSSGSQWFITTVII